MQMLSRIVRNKFRLPNLIRILFASVFPIDIEWCWHTCCCYPTLLCCRRKRWISGPCYLSKAIWGNTGDREEGENDGRGERERIMAGKGRWEWREQTRLGSLGIVRLFRSKWEEPFRDPSFATLIPASSSPSISVSRSPSSSPNPQFIQFSIS